MTAKRLHLVDGTYELFRANFSKRPDHTAPNGLSMKGVVGLVASLLALLHDEAEAVSHIGVAFDNPIRSFRNDLFDGYKSDEGLPRRSACRWSRPKRRCARSASPCGRWIAGRPTTRSPPPRRASAATSRRCGS